MRPKTPFISIAVLVCVVANTEASAYDLPFFGELPGLGSEWSMRGDDGVRGKYSWVNFERDGSDEVLSFVAWKFGSPDVKVSHGPVGQASIETFRSDGAARFSTASAGTPIAEMVRYQFVSVNARDQSADVNASEEAIEYTYIYEGDGDSPPSMAHGYVIVVEDVVLFVQHTSSRPFTSELAADVSARLWLRHVKSNTPNENGWSYGIDRKDARSVLR